MLAPILWVLPSCSKPRLPIAALIARARSSPAAGSAVPEDDRELVAAEPRHEIAGTHARPDGLGDAFEQQVAGGVSAGVVDRLEIVEIDIEEEMLGIRLAAAVPISSDIVLSRLARFARPVSESWAAACASWRCKVRASVKSWNTMTEPLNSPLLVEDRRDDLADAAARTVLARQHGAVVVLDALPQAAKHRGAGDLLAAFLIDGRVDLVERDADRLLPTKRRSASRRPDS